MPCIRYIRGNCAGHMYIRYSRMHAVLQRYFLKHSLSGSCFEFPNLSPSTAVHQLELNIILIVTVTRKGGGVRRAEGLYITAVIIPAVYYTKNDLVASK